MSERQEGLDVLRVISVLMVLFLHIPMGKNYEYGSSGYIINAFTLSMSYTAVNIFALISGYCMCEKKTSTAKFISLWAEVFFYSILNLTLTTFVLNDALTIKRIISALFPALSGFLWYATAYLAMYIFIPYFNNIISTLGVKKTKKLIWSLLLVFGLGSWIGNLNTFGGGITLGVENGYSVIWISILFLVGAAIKKYGFSLFFTKSKGIKQIWFLIFAIMSGLLVFVSEFFIYRTTGILFKNPLASRIFWNYCSPLVVLEALFLLEFFSKLKIKATFIKKIVRNLGGFCFGIMLFNNTPAFLKIVYPNILIENNLNLLFRLTSGVISAFVICVVIDFVRQFIFKFINIKKNSENIAIIIDKGINQFLEI